MTDDQIYRVIKDANDYGWKWVPTIIDAFTTQPFTMIRRLLAFEVRSLSYA